MIPSDTWMHSSDASAAQQCCERPLHSALTNVVLPHLLQFVHSQLLLLQAPQHDGAQVGELPEGVGEVPQPLVDHLAQGEQSTGHERPALPQSDLKQGPHDPSSVLWATEKHQQRFHIAQHPSSRVTKSGRAAPRGHMVVLLAVIGSADNVM